MKKHLIAFVSVSLLAGCSNAAVSSVSSPYQYDQSLSDGKVMIRDEHNLYCGSGKGYPCHDDGN